MKKLRPSAVPLVTVDPFFSIWSAANNLYDDTTRHWGGFANAMSGFVRIDEKWYRFMGHFQSYKMRMFPEIAAIPQTDCTVEATKSIYKFENDIVALEVVFRTPLLLDDLYLMSRPVSYISYELRYKDGEKHNTEIYFDISGEVCTDKLTQKIGFGRTDYSIYCGRGDKDVLEKSGDQCQIEWGCLHLIAPDFDCRCYDDFKRMEKIKWNKDSDEISGEKDLAECFPVLSAIKNCGSTASEKGVILLAYDDIYSIEYFGEKLKGYWTENGDSFEMVVKKAIDEYAEICKKCDKFDAELREKAAAISEKYADIICLSYRQVIAAHKLVAKDGKLLFFSKECASNGCIGTVDITYPSMPMFLLFRPDLVEGMLNPIFDYVDGEYGWNFDFAPHDVGQYPKANGQVYRLDTEDAMSHMPVEECGNMLLCVAALCKAENDFTYAKKHIKNLKKWADYLLDYGYDPENQLCTDDFAGHLAHNANLSIKAILAIAAFGYIQNNLDADGNVYIEKAKEFAEKWAVAAKDTDHYRLAFDKEGSWSLKYNLIWDKYFDFNIFDKEIAKTEIEFYKTKFNKYGIPLDSRKGYTKSDWQMWTVCLAEDSEYRDMVIEHMWDFINETINRVAFSDYYETETPEQVCFQNRTVQGGLFAPLLFQK